MWLLTLNLWLATSPPPEPRLDYRIAFESTSVRVEVCPSHPVAELRLRAQHAAAPAALREVPAGVERDGQRTLLYRDLSPGACARYSSAIDQRHSTSRYLPLAVAGGWLLDPEHWLWLPRAASKRDIRLRFEPQPGEVLYTPFPVAADGWSRLGNWQPGYWGATVAIGAVDRQTLELAQGRVDLGIVGVADQAARKRLATWVRHGVEALESALGGLPMDPIRVLVIGIGPQSEVVPWGMVNRGGAATAYLYVDHTRSLEALLDDWTLWHELVHFAHPPLAPSARWMSEGLASYLQHQLQLEAGVIDAAQAAARLEAGFGRGRRDAIEGLNLTQASAQLGRLRAYKHVYWSGAAWWLDIDGQLRARGSSLFQLLGGHARAGLAGDVWTADQYARQLQALSPIPDLAEQARTHGASVGFPQLARTPPAGAAKPGTP